MVITRSGKVFRYIPPKRRNKHITMPNHKLHTTSSAEEAGSSNAPTTSGVTVTSSTTATTVTTNSSVTAPNTSETGISEQWNLALGKALQGSNSPPTYTLNKGPVQRSPPLAQPQVSLFKQITQPQVSLFDPVTLPQASLHNTTIQRQFNVSNPTAQPQFNVFNPTFSATSSNVPPFSSTSLPSSSSNATSSSSTADLASQISQLQQMVAYLASQQNAQPQQQNVPFNTAPHRPYVDKIPIPAFSRDNVEMWFFQLETRFNHLQIHDDEQKFCTLVECIDTPLLMQVSGAVKTAQRGQRYDTLRAAIVANFADSETQQLKKLLQGIPLGSHKPSTLLNTMRNTYRNPNAEQQGLLRHFWLEQLPPEARSIIVANKLKSIVNISLDEEARLADGIVETLEMSRSIQGIQQVQTTTQSAKVEDTSSIDMNELTAMVSELYKHYKSNKDSRPRSRSRQRSNEKNQDRNGRDKSAKRQASKERNGSTCYYHRNFGVEARKCTAPCNFSTSKGEQSKN